MSYNKKRTFLAMADMDVDDGLSLDSNHTLDRSNSVSKPSIDTRCYTTKTNLIDNASYRRLDRLDSQDTVLLEKLGKLSVAHSSSIPHANIQTNLVLDKLKHMAVNEIEHDSVITLTQHSPICDPGRNSKSVHHSDTPGLDLNPRKKIALLNDLQDTLSKLTLASFPSHHAPDSPLFGSADYLLECSHELEHPVRQSPPNTLLKQRKDSPPSSHKKPDVQRHKSNGKDAASEFILNSILEDDESGRETDLEDNDHTTTGQVMFRGIPKVLLTRSWQELDAGQGMRFNPAHAQLVLFRPNIRFDPSAGIRLKVPSPNRSGYNSTIRNSDSRTHRRVLSPIRRLSQSTTTTGDISMDIA
ncbi:hypothetical protein BATDEDRAFT_90412 [Batrachochytrium dendrobatidis JAM81]|uniref:Uncharacterized protein n=2 Tax=Batrachochytrium dendrobatidis TaxID=109871 RepID=F4P7Z8_BATDJ|nr:uncharacterized protein BATDEDRAFT_90412 [Batrachochytrium dendrobatidis JAM81]EGF78663.1 hypothetical protein BATDEDRAFT_90412 [Batrachochytrium dendrobatidis JAM81]OAJ43528.1 hypothetical protein BDEG_26881 [Batrachochytrium dendrobatidis JEL423]|eukprot:XP_006680934.1 hypothetical protein BATDEDRAFT_90412 [Batrachochytrium dendrobatidis JAM81]